MGTVPRSVLELLQFASARAEAWPGVAAQIGLTEAQANAFAEASTLARQRVDAATAAEDARKAATLASQQAVRDLRRSLGDSIALIRAFAENQPKPSSVYAIAQLPPPAVPAPIPAPGRPSDFTVSLSQSGALLLRWKCINPPGAAGTIYEVRRRTGSVGSPMVFIGASGVKSFTDDTLAAGATGVTYEVTAVRSTRRGLPAQFNVNFGVSNGVPFASIEPVKLAA